MISSNDSELFDGNFFGFNLFNFYRNKNIKTTSSKIHDYLISCNRAIYPQPISISKEEEETTVENEDPYNRLYNNTTNIIASRERIIKT